jgi:hypothetical protein
MEGLRISMPPPSAVKPVGVSIGKNKPVSENSTRTNLVKLYNISNSIGLHGQLQG